MILNYLNKKYWDILSKAKAKSLSRKNFDISDLKIDNFFNKIPLRKLLLFYVDFENFFKENPSFIFENIKIEHLDNLLKIIVKDNIVINNRIMIEKIDDNKRKIILNFFNIKKISDFPKILRNPNRFCKKCGSLKNHIIENELFCNCDIIGTCEFCGKQCISKKQLSEHYTKKHNINWFKMHRPNQPDLYCIFCREKIDSRITEWNIIKPHLCKNPNCPNFKERQKNKLKKFSKTIKSRKNFNNINYVNASYRREEIFKNTILENGETLKQNISKKAGPKTSKTMKEKILNGSFTPDVTNFWCNSLINYKNKKFRSSWEIAFYLLNEGLDYEITRIKYFSSKYNQFKTYIVDFTDFKNRVLYEIKPNSKIDDITNQEKFKAAELFSQENSFSFRVISEFFLLKNLENIKEKYYKNLDLFCDESKVKMLKLIKQLERLKNENSINRRN